MRYLIKISTILLCLIALLSPVSALITNVSTNVTPVSHSYLHDSQYMPVDYVYVFILIGIACLAISRIWESTEDIFSICAVIPLGLSAWFSNYMATDYTTINEGTIYNAQIITPNPYLSLVMLIFFIVSILNVIWIFYLKRADNKTGEA
jgi:hypothetical protein